MLRGEHLTLRKDDVGRMLASVEPGSRDWKEYEDTCISILEKLFCPPLASPRTQSFTKDGLDIRDGLFSNGAESGAWSRLLKKVPHQFVVCEFKNWSRKIGKAAINQVRLYLERKTIGKLGLVFCRRGASPSGRKAQDVAYRDSNAVILVLTDDDLLKMAERYELNGDAGELIEEMVDEFMVRY